MNPRFNHDKQKQRWIDFETDEKEFQSNREKYKGISSKPENFSWYYRHQNRQIKSEKRLADIYAFKLDFECKDKQSSGNTKRGFD